MFKETNLFLRTRVWALQQMTSNRHQNQLSVSHTLCPRRAMNIERTFGKLGVAQFVIHRTVAPHRNRQVPTVPHNNRIIRKFPALRKIIRHQKFLTIQDGKQESPSGGFLKGFVKKSTRQTGVSFIWSDTNPLNAGNVVPEVPRRCDCPNNNGNVSDDLPRFPNDD